MLSFLEECELYRSNVELYMRNVEMFQVEDLLEDKTLHQFAFLDTKYYVAILL